MATPSLAQLLDEAQTALAAASPDSRHSVTWSADDETVAELDLTAVDRLACSVWELRLAAGGVRPAAAAPDLPAVAQGSFAAHQQWSEAICRRVTYLLEQLGLVEQDGENQAVLVRSTLPTRQGHQRLYYEAQIQVPGRLTLRRFVSGSPGQPRQQVNMLLTREALDRLLHHLVEAAHA